LFSALFVLTDGTHQEYGAVAQCKQQLTQPAVVTQFKQCEELPGGQQREMPQLRYVKQRYPLDFIVALFKHCD